MKHQARKQVMGKMSKESNEEQTYLEDVPITPPAIRRHPVLNVGWCVQKNPQNAGFFVREIFKQHC